MDWTVLVPVLVSDEVVERRRERKIKNICEKFQEQILVILLDAEMSRMENNVNEFKVKTFHFENKSTKTKGEFEEKISNLKPSFDTRRNTETLHHFNGASCEIRSNGKNTTHHQQRRHTIVPGVTKTKLFETETKLMVLEFLQKNGPRNETLTHRLRQEKRLEDVRNAIQQKEFEENSTDITVNTRSGYTVKEQMKHCTEKVHTGNTTKGAVVINEKKICKKRPSRKQRKVSTEKAKTVTIGECQRKQMLDKINNNKMDSSKSEQGRRKYKRSSSDLTQTQYLAMKKKFKEMEMPLIKWLTEHVKLEEINESNEEEIIGEVMEEFIVPVEENLLEVSQDHYLPITETKSNKDRLKPNLRLTMPRRSLYQLLESNAFTPETFAVQRLEKISNEIMNDYGELLADPITDLLTPIRKTDSITYDVFACVAREVYAMASDSVMSRVALLLNMVRETMLIGNLDESQLELLVDHSTKFVTENASQSLLEEGIWDALDEPMFSSNTDAEKTEKERGDNDEFDDVEEGKGTWAPYGMAALTVGIGLAYSVMKT